MVLGFNHNIQYKGEIFHIQTEDSGIATPHIITLLYRGGTIIASKKTSYADIIKADNLEQVVEELMKEQHKEMLRRLKSGEFDEKAFGQAAGVSDETANEVKDAHVSPQPEAASAPAEDESARQPQSLDEIILDYLVTEDHK
jgi:ketol-acid reductoisomerase